MQLVRAEVLDDCSPLLHPGLPLFTVGGFNSSSCTNIMTSNNKLEELNHTVAVLNNFFPLVRVSVSQMHARTVL